MRTTTKLGRRTSTLALAGVLAFAGVACDDDDEGGDIEIEETEDTDGDTGGDTGGDAETEESTDMTETEDATE